MAYLTAILVFIGGIPGTAHHYFWYGGPSVLAGHRRRVQLVGADTADPAGRPRVDGVQVDPCRRASEFPYRWPLYFLTASSVWNFLGAGVFGFLINLPIINYYEHATYLTTNHAHTALFGVYGMLAIALILFSWRGLVRRPVSGTTAFSKLSFWGLNVGLFLMFLTGLLPIGLMQVVAQLRPGPLVRSQRGLLRIADRADPGQLADRPRY